MLCNPSLPIRVTNERLFGEFVGTQKDLTKGLFTELPTRLNLMTEKLDNLNKSIDEAYQQYNHTFFMMRYILRSVRLL